MKKLKRIAFHSSASTIFMLLTAFYVSAAEKIIQQEKLSFQRCLQVIETSKDKLSVAPEILDVSDQNRVAVFTLVDGILTIKCDGENGNVTVSTDTN